MALLALSTNDSAKPRKFPSAALPGVLCIHQTSPEHHSSVMAVDSLDRKRGGLMARSMDGGRVEVSAGSEYGVRSTVYLRE